MDIQRNILNEDSEQYFVTWMDIQREILNEYPEQYFGTWMNIHREIRFTLPLLALAAAQDLPGLSEDFHKDCKYISKNIANIFLKIIPTW